MASLQLFRLKNKLVQFLASIFTSNKKGLYPYQELIELKIMTRIKKYRNLRHGINRYFYMEQKLICCKFPNLREFIIKFYIKLPSYSFTPSKNAQDSDGYPNGKYTIIGRIVR